jgi:hypothetical protein
VEDEEVEEEEEEEEEDELWHMLLTYKLNEI